MVTRAYNLLMITQKVDEDDSVLGFFCGWLAEFAKHCGRLTIIALTVGHHHLPENVVVLGLGKERGGSKLIYLARFFKYIWQVRKNYDSVLVHMNPEYLALAGPFWRLASKRALLWYVHRQSNWKLRLASLWAYRILTVSQGSIALKNKKVLYLGHGIDTKLFMSDGKQAPDEKLNIISVGRLSRIKNLETLLAAAKILRERLGDSAFHISLIGPAVTVDDRTYVDYLKGLVKNYRLDEVVYWVAPQSYSAMPRWYRQGDLAVNLAPTGGLDKVVLEAAACGLPTLVANESFIPYLGEYRTELFFTYGSGQDLAQKILQIRSLPAHDKARLSRGLRHMVVVHHNLSELIQKIIQVYDL